MKKLYHGSIFDFDDIDVNKGRGYKDFGRGFYTTAVASHAEKLALRNKAIAERRNVLLDKSKDSSKRIPVVAYRYNYICSEQFENLKVKIFEKADSEWLRFIIENRLSKDSVHDYDIVIGPTADAETTTIINEYFDELKESGYAEEICQKVIDELKPENLPKQYFFRTKEAIQTLKSDTIKRQVIN